MKKSMIIFSLVVLSFFCCYPFKDIKAAKVSPNGDFTIRGEKYNINTTPARIGQDTSIKKVQMYKDKTVSEICKYTESDEDNPKDVKWLFIYEDGSASIGWIESDLYGDNPGDNRGYESMIRNWNHGLSSFNWDANNSELTEAYDAYSAYKNSDKCPYYIIDNEYWGRNYFYISTEEGFDNLEKLQHIAKNNYVFDSNNEVVKESGNLHALYLQADLDGGERSNLECDYEYTDEDGITKKAFKLKFDSNENPIVEKLENANSDGTTIADYKTSSEFISTKYWSYVEKGKCPNKILSCERTSGVDSQKEGTEENIYRELYGDEAMFDNVSDCNKRVEFYCIGNKCSSGECGKYSDFYNDLREKINSYKECGDDRTCRKNSLSEYNDTKDIIVGFCDSVLKNLNYSKGGCVEACLNLSKDITALEIDAKLKSGYEDVKCNIGSSVISMLYNVLKWEKYIAPALVIILSILDFIKAIASQSEDDMKKAQGKFVKRLIVAAILFLLPLIINFLLKTFGLYSSECSITNLFG